MMNDELCLDRQFDDDDDDDMLLLYNICKSITTCVSIYYSCSTYIHKSLYIFIIVSPQIRNTIHHVRENICRK